MTLIARTHAFDTFIVQSRSTQIVLLGAGFDARAYRLKELSNAKIFEVDAPAT